MINGVTPEKEVSQEEGIINLIINVETTHVTRINGDHYPWIVNTSNLVVTNLSFQMRTSGTSL